MDLQPQIDIDQILENEHLYNKSESWNKLHKTTKIQRLHLYAEKYGTTNNYSIKEIRLLKHFLSDSIERKKLLKTKEVNYNKKNGEITDIPGLLFNTGTNNFTLRADTKRPSTLNALTPKRMTQKNQKIDENKGDSL